MSTVDSENFALFDFGMSFLDGCLNDELSLPSIIEDFDYYIAYTGSHVVPTPTYAQALRFCPISWTLVALDDSEEIPLSATQKKFI